MSNKVKLSKQSNMSKGKNKKRQEDFNKLLATLRGLSIEDLLLLYIEAKTGSEKDVDKLPTQLLISVEELGRMIDKLYADRLIGDVFKETPE